MSLRSRPTDTRHLTGSALVLSAGPHAGPPVSRTALLGLVLALGLAGAYWSGELAGAPSPAQEPLQALQRENRELRRALEQARLAAGLSEARSRELERQIDGLHGQLREQQTQLMFFRKAQDANTRRAGDVR